MIGIYKITSPTNKIYIGQSVNIEKRFKSYLSIDSRNSQQVRLHRSFLKYGVLLHKFETIEECQITELNYRERYWQDFYNVIDFGLNCRLTTTKSKSGKLSAETVNKLKGRKMSKESKEKLSRSLTGKFKGELNPFYGKKHTNETKLKISLANKGKLSGEKNPSFGKIKSEETRKKISLANLGNKYCLNRELSEDTKSKIANSLFKKVIDTSTGKIYISVSHLAEIKKISKHTLFKKLGGNVVNNTNYKYL